MRIVSRTTRSIADRQREQSLRRRAAAGSLVQSYPGLESIRIQLQFIPTTGIAPAAQTHALYPSAPAYFEFPCPYGDCDGRYDLGNSYGVVQEMRFAPFGWRDITRLAAVTATPFVPLLLTVFSLEDFANFIITAVF